MAWSCIRSGSRTAFRARRQCDSSGGACRHLLSPSRRRGVLRWAGCPRARDRRRLCNWLGFRGRFRCGHRRRGYRCPFPPDFLGLASPCNNGRFHGRSRDHTLSALLCHDATRKPQRNSKLDGRDEVAHAFWSSRRGGTRRGRGCRCGCFPQCISLSVSCRTRGAKLHARSSMTPHLLRAGGCSKKPRLPPPPVPAQEKFSRGAQTTSWRSTRRSQRGPSASWSPPA